MAKSTGLKYGPLSYIVSESSPLAGLCECVTLTAGPFSAHLLNRLPERLHGGGGGGYVVGDRRGGACVVPDQVMSTISKT